MPLYLSPGFGKAFMLNHYHFIAIFHFYTPCKRQETYGFVAFAGGVKMEHL